MDFAVDELVGFGIPGGVNNGSNGDGMTCGRLGMFREAGGVCSGCLVVPVGKRMAWMGSDEHGEFDDGSARLR